MIKNLQNLLQKNPGKNRRKSVKNDQKLIVKSIKKIGYKIPSQALKLHQKHALKTPLNHAKTILKIAITSPKSCLNLS